MKRTIYGLIITTLALTTVFAFAACSSGDETASTKDNSSEMNKEMDQKDGEMDHGDSSDKKAESSDFSSQRNSQTAAIIDAYDQTKSGLDANDKTKTAEGAKMMLAALEKFDAGDLSESQSKEYSEIAETAKEHAEHIVKSELDHKKEHFESLTKDIKDLFALVGEDKKE
ncbi:MAG: DUF3347 domain-containing protein [Aridibacter sp.]